jgi:hypothetical protein
MDHTYKPEVDGSPTVFSFYVAGFSGKANLISKSLTFKLLTFEELI